MPLERSFARIARSLGIAGVVGLALSLAGAAPALPAFPGAQGFGSQTRGGRGGALLFVDNLNDSGPGSLRAAIDTPGCRFVIFSVGGTIWLETPLEIIEGCLTIAGQTALGQGIELRNDTVGSTGLDTFPSLIVNAPDVVVRHLKIRPGIPDPDPLAVRGSSRVCASWDRSGRPHECIGPCGPW